MGRERQTDRERERERERERAGGGGGVCFRMIGIAFAVTGHLRPSFYSTPIQFRPVLLTFRLLVPVISVAVFVVVVVVVVVVVGGGGGDVEDSSAERRTWQIYCFGNTEI